MKRLLVALGLLVLEVIRPFPAFAAELVLHPSAVDAALVRELFTSQGRYVLSGDPASCLFAYVERPQSSFRNARYFLQVQFTGRTGFGAPGQCVGPPPESFPIALSAEPYFKGSVLGLRDVRLESGPSLYRPLLEVLITVAAPRAIDLDLREDLPRILRESGAPYEVTLSRLDVQQIATTGNTLSVRFDFRLEAK